MIRRLILPLAALFCACAAFSALAQTSVQFGLQTGSNPRNLCVYDSTHACVTTGSLDSTLHVFTPSIPNGTVTNSMLANPSVMLSPASYGAKCDGTTDDTTALQSWAAAFTTGTVGYIPGVCVFKSALTFGASGAADGAIYGNGKGSVLLYTGVNSLSGAGVTIGNTSTAFGGCSANGWTLSDFRVMSTVAMTSATGLEIAHMCEGHIRNVEVGGDLDGRSYNGPTTNTNANWYNAVQFYGGNTIEVIGFSFAATGQCVVASGDPAIPLVGLQMTQGKITHCNVGVHLAGNTGGTTLDHVDTLETGVNNLLIDQATIALPNQQTFIGSGFASDQTNGEGIYLNEAGVFPQSTLTFGGDWWCASATGSGHACIHISSAATNYTINMSGGWLGYNGGNGLTNDSTSAFIHITGTYIGQNGLTGGGYGVYSSVANPNIVLSDIHWGVGSGVNVSGNYNVNIATVSDPVSFAITPQLNFGGAHVGMATGAASGVCNRFGKRVTCDFNIALTAVGSSTGLATITSLPFTSSGVYSGLAILSYTSGMSGLASAPVTGFVSLGTTSLNLVQQNATTTTNLTNSNFTSSSVIYGTVSYLTP